LIIECLLTGKSHSLSPDNQLISPQNLIPIYHLHGIRTNPDSIIITQEDYISLFRPNQYRQQKLSLSFKESTTLIIGYGLGDVNVLTAVDWTKNVYVNQRISYPHEIIQLLYVDKPTDNPYKDINDILIIEFNNLQSILEEIACLTKSERIDHNKKSVDLASLNKIFILPQEHHITAFIDDEDFRSRVVDDLCKNDECLSSGFLELFSRSIDETWVRSEPDGAFEAYNQNLILLLDVILNIGLSKIPPALLESVAYNLFRVSYYIGNVKGKSISAFKTWERRKTHIPDDTLKELINIAYTRNYTRLRSLLKFSK
jgi:hypothetical protein